MLNALCLLALQSKTIEYDLYRADKLIGEAKILIRITQDGGKRTDTKLTLKQNGKKLDMHSTQVWAFSGRPTLKIVQILDDKGVETGKTRVDFKTNEAVVTTFVGDKSEKKSIAIEPKVEIRDLAEFWFLRDEPTKDEEYKYKSFDTSGLKWADSKSVYLGEETKAVKGKSMSLHHIRQTVGDKKIDNWVDSDGFPVISESSDQTKIIAKF